MVSKSETGTGFSIDPNQRLNWTVNPPWRASSAPTTPQPMSRMAPFYRWQAYVTLVEIRCKH
jgi:hypothetical protein